MYSCHLWLTRKTSLCCIMVLLHRAAGDGCMSFPSHCPTLKPPKRIILRKSNCAHYTKAKNQLYTVCLAEIIFVVPCYLPLNDITDWKLQLVLEELSEKGLHIYVASDCAWGKELTSLIQRAKIVLNIHLCGGEILQSRRIMESISLGAVVRTVWKAWIVIEWHATFHLFLFHL